MNKTPLVLVVDDNPQNVQMLGTILMENRLNPAAARNGAQALEFIKKKKPDLILLDIMMPEMDGFEVLKRLKQDGLDMPVIFLSAKNKTEDVIAGLELGAVDYVTKPFNRKELMTRVNTHLELKAAKDELKQSNATKDKFFSIVAHDLGNVFSGLIGLSNLLITKEVNDAKTFLPMIKQSSEMGYNLLRNLLEWSRIQTGKMKANPRKLDLKPLIYQNTSVLKSQTSAKQIKIISEIDNTLVFADEHMLDTIIRNLLSNAIKFTPNKGTIEISYKREDEWIEISISDTGVGIAPENIEKLFRLDVSYSTHGTSNEKGTGLGLILCKEFVEKNGGTIWVESEEGKGSQFYVRLPASRG